MITAASVAVIVCWAYIASAIFLIAFDQGFEDATPLTLYQYWFYYGAEQQVKEWVVIAGCVSLMLVGAPLGLIFAPAKKSLFGDARFALRSEIRKAGLFGEQGIIVGKLDHRYLMFDGEQHAIVSAQTRSGKGVGIVIPNLLNWPHSVVVIDIKQENWDLTSGVRKQYGQECYLFNPIAANYRTHRYNPLAYISEDPNFRIDDVQKIANMLLPDKPNVDVIWTATPRTLFLGIVLYLLETPGKPVTFGQVLRETLVEGDGAAYFARIINMRALDARVRTIAASEAAKQAAADLTVVLSDKTTALVHPHLSEMAMWYHASASYRNTLEEKNAARQKADSTTPDVAKVLRNSDFHKETAKITTPLTGACVRALNAYVSITAEKTRAGVIAAVRSSLELWMNPLVDAATSANDFDLRDIRKQRMSIYLGVPPSSLDRLAPLFNLFFEQLIDLNTRELPAQNRAIKYPCLLLTDELTSLGKINVLSKGIAYLAAYWLRMLCVIQSPQQLDEVYGKHAAETFTTNHALQIVYPPKATEIETAKEISEWLGYQTVKGKSESKGKGLFTKRSRSESFSDQRRALLLPQEIINLGQRRELVIMENMRPIVAQKVVYYKDPVFVDRLKQVSPSLRALGSAIPTEEQFKSAAMSGELSAFVPMIDLEAHHKSVEGNEEPATLTAPQIEPQTGTSESPATAADIPNLGDLKLAVFKVEWEDGEAPKPGDLDKTTLHAYADRLYNSVSTERRK